jgi:3-oxoacyl-[acyl-carrier-protein] synthase II
MKDVRVVITGIGVISPIGIGKQTFWRNLMAGVNGIREIQFMDTGDYRTHRGGEVLDFNFSDYVSDSNGTSRLGRASQFAVAAALMAWNDAGVQSQQLDPYRAGIAGGTANGEGRIFEAQNEAWFRHGIAALDRASLPHFPSEAIFTAVARHLKIKGPTTVISTVCAAGNYAIGYAADLLQSGTVDLMLAGGSDPFSKIAFTGFNAMMAVAPERCQPFDLRRRGMCLSEGCAMLVLEPLEKALARGAHIYAEVAACGLCNDAFHMTAPHPLGRGAVTAMTNALREANLLPEQVDYINAHGTGTPVNDKVETRAIKTVFADHAYRVPVSSIKSMIGHAQGAASALEAVACALAIEHNQIPPTINYCEKDPDCDLDYVPNQGRAHKVNVACSNAFALGGNCSALLLKRCQP